MLSYDQALQQVLETVAPLPPRNLPLAEAVGLVLADPAGACWDMPLSDNSAMDGFALAGATGSGTSYQVIGAAYAGHPFAGRLAPGEAIRITTGAPVPAGAVSVVPQEETDDRGDRVLLQEPPAAGSHIRFRGEEFSRGETLLPAGTRLSAGGIGLLASAGVSEVSIHPRPRVAIFSTGDELVELGQQPGPGQIVNSNLQLLAARLRECGCEPLPLGVGKDTPGALEAILRRAVTADLVLTTGGVSVGAKDLVQDALNGFGFQRKFWKVAIRPGKPVLFGLLGGKPCFGLPGNPAATAATFELFVKPALRKLAGDSDPIPGRRQAVLQNDIECGGNRQAFLWSRVEWRGNGYQVSVPQRQGSGQNRSIQGANALLAAPIGREQLAAGETVEILML
jgi:molybdopterin molybdotransferase